MMEVQLYDSTFCRLCGEENSNGVLLFPTDESETDLSGLVNRYLPFKVYDDGKLPRTICPGCNIQLQATVQFFDLLVDGQRRLRTLWKSQLEFMRRAERDRMRLDKDDSSEILMTTTTSAHDPNASDAEGENRIVIQIMADGSLYSTDHEMTLKMEGLDRPRRKRGRPKKVPQPDPPEQLPELIEHEPETCIEEEPPPDDEMDEDADKRRRRKRKAPQRFLEAVRGKELERMFREEGVIDDDDPDDGEDEVEEKGVDEHDVGEEVIGHLENQEGQDLGELVIVNKSKNRGRPRGKRRKHRFQCEVCGRGFQHRGRYFIHKSYHKGVKFECSDCNKRFTARETFELHQKTTGHTGEGIIEGLEDGKDVVDAPTKNRFPCEQCDKTFQTKQSYEVHIKAIHEGQKPFTCEVCNKTFAYHNSLKAHMAIHEEQRTEKGYPCEVCGKIFNHPSSVIYHKEAEHNNGRRFVCNKCGKGFKHKQLLQRHQLVHSDNRPFACNVCGATFKTKANLLNHQPTHTGEKKYFCELCGQQFAHKTSLTLHYRWHTGHKPYQCEVCSKSFSQNGNLQEHLRIHTGEKPYCCNYCGRKFTTSSQFKLHVKRHTGERPWKCEFCGKSFLHKDTWKCHTRRHKGERPFKCQYCSRGFTEQWALKKHLRLHTGEKPYVCNICSKPFADCSNLTKHKKVHRDIKEEENVVPQESVPVDGTVWNIIRSHLSETAKVEGDEGDAIVGEGVKKEDESIQQIIYVTYQDPEDPGEARTLHIVDGIQDEAAAGLHEDKSDHMRQISAEVQPQEEEVDPEAAAHLQLDQLSQTATIQLEPQLHVTDQDGNAIQFTIQDGIPTGNVQSIEVSGANFHLATAEEQSFAGSLATHLPAVAERGAEVPDIADSEQTGAAQVGAADMLALVGSDQTLEFVTPDGQKVYRFVTAYNVDQQQLAADYLSAT